MESAANPFRRLSTVFLVALSLSIGWGMRGNFGHESGAWIPGALAAIAVALLSGRQDWRERVHYFALFGGLGLGFGGSISYMYAISFASSGHLPTTWYGFFVLVYEGALWCGLGGAGMALAASASRERLTALIVPMCFAIAGLILLKFIEDPVAYLLSPAAAGAADSTWFRHESPLYWFDSDWFSALMAFLAVCVFDLLSRWRDKGYVASLAALGAFLAVGAVCGGLVQMGLKATDMEERVADALVVPLADPTVVNPETGIRFGEEISTRTGEAFGTSNFLTNWPQFFSDHPNHVGWGVGLFLGWVVYFLVFGKWKNDSGLLVCMSLGWLVAFLLMPVLGTAALYHIGQWRGADALPLYGGFRMMPPRSDDWAGITGVFLGAMIYCLRKDWGAVALGATLSGLIGGILFATMQLIRSLLWIPGHAGLTPGGTPADWAFYHSANWHSVLEQSQGFGHGIAFAVTAAVLWSRVKPHENEPRVRPWTEPFAVAFVLLLMTYANLYKNVAEWTRGGNKVVPEAMKPPLIADHLTPESVFNPLVWLFGFTRGEPLSMSALTWFNLVWVAVAIMLIALMVTHMRGRRVALLPDSWLGRGQLLYVLVLWGMVIGNFERALPSFHESRLITEWVLFIHASLATFLLAYLPREAVTPVPLKDASFGRMVGMVWAIGIPVVLVVVSLYTAITRGVYGDTPTQAAELSHKRFGPEAHWRIKPMLKEGEHR